MTNSLAEYFPWLRYIHTKPKKSKEGGVREENHYMIERERERAEEEKSQCAYVSFSVRNGNGGGGICSQKAV